MNWKTIPKIDAHVHDTNDLDGSTHMLLSYFTLDPRCILLLQIVSGSVWIVNFRVVSDY